MLELIIKWFLENDHGGGRSREVCILNNGGRRIPIAAYVAEGDYDK